MLKESSPYTLAGYSPLARAIKIMAWFDQQRTFPTAEQFQNRFGGSRSTAHRILNIIEQEKDAVRPRGSNGSRGKAHGPD